MKWFGRNCCKNSKASAVEIRELFRLSSVITFLVQCTFGQWDLIPFGKLLGHRQQDGLPTLPVLPFLVPPMEDSSILPPLEVAFIMKEMGWKGYYWISSRSWTLLCYKKDPSCSTPSIPTCSQKQALSAVASPFQRFSMKVTTCLLYTSDAADE